MPIGLSKAPKTLPRAAQTLWVGTFNGVFDSCDGPEKECDARAARIAWDQIKGKYRKVKDQWILRKSEAFQDVLLTITKASLQPDGSVRWQAVASDTGKDRAEERTSVELFQDWIDRITYKSDISYLPAPKMPFLGVSHYPALEGFGEAGTTGKMFIDGNVFKADGIFNADSAIGQELLGAVKAELALIKKGGQPEKPIRISAGWWDIEHYHSDSNFLFTRQALTDKCPLCDKGQTGDKIYKAGQLDHFAATRVPMNPRTSLELEEKSMAKTTRKEDAQSIVSPDLAEEMERRAQIVGKSDTEENELHPAMVTKAATKLGNFIKLRREGKDMTISQLAADTPVSASTIGDLERGNIAKPSKRDLSALATALNVEEAELTGLIPEDEAETAKASHMKPGEFLRNIRRKKKTDHGDVEKRMGFKRGRLKRIEDDEEDFPFEMMAKLVDALDMDDDEAEDFGRRFGKKRKAEHEDDEDDEDEVPAKGSKKDLLARFGNKRRKTPPTKKADVEKDFDGDEMFVPVQPLGGATNMGEARDFIDTKEKFGKLRSHWDVFQAVVGNIMLMQTDDADQDQAKAMVKAMGQAVKDLGRQIDTLKAGLSDAFLIQESAAAYDDFLTESDVESTHIFGHGEVAEDADEYIEYSEDDNDNEVITMTTEHPADQMKAVIDAAIENKSLTSVDRETAVQDAFNEYAEGVQVQLHEANPASQADQIAGAIKGALTDVLTPFTEQMALMTAKMGSVETQQPQGVAQLHEVYVPQQKSMLSPTETPQPVLAQEGGLPISPSTGKPSALTARIRKSVGLIT